MSERPKIIFDNKEVKPKQIRFDDLVPGKSYVAAEQIVVHIGEQDIKERSERRDIGSLIIPPGGKFKIDSSRGYTTAKGFILDGGVQVIVSSECFPKKEVLVYERLDSDSEEPVRN